VLLPRADDADALRRLEAAVSAVDVEPAAALAEEITAAAAVVATGKTVVLFEFFLCLSRACLGKMIIFNI
jgi:hypothetical protein